MTHQKHLQNYIKIYQVIMWIYIIIILLAGTACTTINWIIQTTMLKAIYQNFRIAPELGSSLITLAIITILLLHLYLFYHSMMAHLMTLQTLINIDTNIKKIADKY